MHKGGGRDQMMINYEHDLILTDSITPTIFAIFLNKYITQRNK